MSKKRHIIYKIFDFLWIVALMPKELQLIVFAMIVANEARKHPLKVKKLFVPFLLYMAIHFISIIFNSLFGEYDLSRIFAAFNTCFIWGIAILLTSAVDNEIDFKRVGKACARNIVILFVILIVTYVLGIRTVNYVLDTRAAWRTDWLSTGKTVRFRGFMEYDTLTALFVMIQAPVATYYICCKYHNILIQHIFLLVAALPVVATHSRMGMVLIAAECVMMSWYMLDNSRLRRKDIKTIRAVEIFAVLLVGLLFYSKIASALYSLFFLRSGSNSARSRIYLASLSTTWNNSPLIGMGVKKMFGDYPMGSHCTYIGIFYKTGIAGSIVWLMGLGSMIKRLKAKLSRDIFGKYAFVCVLVFLCELLTEDLDGADWLPVVFFAIVTLYLERNAAVK